MHQLYSSKNKSSISLVTIVNFNVANNGTDFKGFTPNSCAVLGVRRVFKSNLKMVEEKDMRLFSTYTVF